MPSRHLLALLSLPLFAAGCDDAAVAPCLPSGCEATRDYDARAYALRARFDWGDKRLIASEDITLALGSGAPPVIELDSAVSVRSVRAGDRGLPYVALPDDTLRVDLAPIAAGTDPVTLTIEYRVRATDFARDPLNVIDNRAHGPDRVVYTQAEPDRGKGWLVGKHDPSDRATWSLEMTVEAGEEVVSPGRRVADRTEGKRRTVRYESAEPLPTYIMAFAAGELAATERAGDVPLTVWARPAPLVPVEAEEILDTIAGQMDALVDRLGPYPFERYGVALLPYFPGGMENAGVSFVAEHRSYSPPLHAHELAHQWFGDWVTMRTEEDAWIKEGMATLLEAEALAPGDGGFARRSLHGHRHSFLHGDAILDRSLRGLDRYTTGTYRRAAWLITQIRAVVGEDAFWASLRGILETHALDSIDGAGFVRSFPLDVATAERVLASIEVVGVPSIELAVTASADGSSAVALSVADAGGVLIAPIDVTVVGADGSVAVHALTAASPVTVAVPAGGYLAVDERGVHPDLHQGFAIDVDAYREELVPLFVPTAPAADAVYRTRAQAHVDRVLRHQMEPPRAQPVPPT